MSKKLSLRLLLSLTAIFAVFIIGLFVGRNMQNTQPRVSKYDANKYTSDTSTTASVTEIGKINLNTANAQDLTMLPGIGEVLAQRILDYRDENGPFQSIEELDNVYGIGAAILDKISNYITVGG